MKRINRRDFLKYSAIASSAVFVPKIVWGSSRKIFSYEGTEKRLVVVQLSGGNDGLNMVVPYRNDIYYSLRPKISLDSKTVLKLNDEMGLNPNMEGIYSLFREGKMCIMNNVGYPNPDHSHFRSMDIWQSASDSNRYVQSGWIGRYLDEICGDNCHSYSAIEVDDTLSLALKGELVKGLAIKSPEQFFNSAGNKLLKEIHIEDHRSKNQSLDYLYRTLRETEASVRYLKQQNNKEHAHGDYPKGEFANKLQKTAQFIATDSDIRTYYISLGGFDTHVKQTDRQNKLLG
jgi:uncharacterized protein (DUF1501 family)